MLANLKLQALSRQTEQKQQEQKVQTPQPAASGPATGWLFIFIVLAMAILMDDKI